MRVRRDVGRVRLKCTQARARSWPDELFTSPRGQTFLLIPRDRAPALTSEMMRAREVRHGGPPTLGRQ
jgi:hypothetical protein